MTTCVAPTTWPRRMTVAWLRRGDGRHLQPLERIETLFARVRVPAERVQIVGKQHGRRFAEPVDARFSRGIFERDDENALGGSAQRGCAANAANPEPGTRTQHQERGTGTGPASLYFCSGGTFTAMTQAASPTPWHACTRTSPLTPTSANRCESAAE